MHKTPFKIWQNSLASFKMQFRYLIYSIHARNQTQFGQNRQTHFNNLVENVHLRCSMQCIEFTSLTKYRQKACNNDMLLFIPRRSIYTLIWHTHSKYIYVALLKQWPKIPIAHVIATPANLVCPGRFNPSKHLFGRSPQ